MRIVFINLHHNNFLLNNYYQIVSNYKIKTYKHKYLLDYFISQNIEILNYIISNNTDELEDEKKKAEYVFSNNCIANDTITNVFDKEEIKKTDVCLVYFHNFKEYIVSKNFDCYKVLMSNHFIRVKKGQYFNLKEDGFSAFVCETDLSRNAFVNTYFNLEGIKLILCPYTYASRFVNKSVFGKRKNRLLAIGTLSTVKGIDEYSGYIDFYNTEWVQPFGVVIMKKEFFNF